MYGFPGAGISFFVGMVLLGAVTCGFGLAPYFREHWTMLGLAAYGCWAIGIGLKSLIGGMSR